MFKQYGLRPRVAGMGVIIGLELDVPLRRLMAAGVCQDIAEDLLAACEGGYLTSGHHEEEDEADG